MEDVLWALQSDANNQHIPTELDWRALAVELSSREAPVVGYDQFDARWNDPEEGPILKKYVQRYDGHGIVLKTDANTDEMGDGEEPGKDKVAGMAAAATKRAFA